MTIVRLTPNGTSLNNGAVTGAGSAHAALSDSSDSSYVTYDNGEASILALTDLDLPAGAKIFYAMLFARVRRGSILSSAVRMDTTVAAGSQSKQSPVIVSWYPPTEVAGAALVGGLSDADLDGANIAIQNGTIFDQLVAYELSLEVMYFVKPTVSVVLPTGTLNENIVTVGWTATFDPQENATTPYFHIKVFNPSQYGAGGFNPDTSPAVFDSGQRQDNITSFTITDTHLPDDDYRAYVRVAPRTDSNHLSDWEYTAFTVDAPNPGEPVMTLTPEDDQGRVKIELSDTAGEIGTDRFHVQRSDDGTSWVNVRTLTGDGQVAAVGGQATVYDYEAPNGVEVTYRVRAFNEATPSYSDWVTDIATWESDVVWLKCATHPSLNWTGILRSYSTSTVPANQGVFRALGAETATVVSDVRGPESGQIVVMTVSQDDRDALAALLDTGSSILVQVPVTNEQPQRWVSFGDQQSDRIVDKAWGEQHDETLPWTLVSAPTGPLEE